MAEYLHICVKASLFRAPVTMLFLWGNFLMSTSQPGIRKTGKMSFPFSVRVMSRNLIDINKEVVICYISLHVQIALRDCKLERRQTFILNLKKKNLKGNVSKRSTCVSKVVSPVMTKLESLIIFILMLSHAYS